MQYRGDHGEGGVEVDHAWKYGMNGDLGIVKDVVEGLNRRR